MQHPFHEASILTSQTLASGLYIIATPIGNLADISLRALQVLNQVDKIYCEDKRVSSRLLQYYGINKPLGHYHDHDDAKKRQQMLSEIESGLSLALISDAGTPLIADPGFKLVRDMHRNGLKLVTIPGPCAAIAALSISGIPSHAFSFIGFLPHHLSKLEAKITPYLTIETSLIAYESATRLKSSLMRLYNIMGNRQVFIARELTKLYEQGVQAPLQQLAHDFDGFSIPLKGEFCLVIDHEKLDEGEEQQIGQHQVDLQTAIIHDLQKKRTLKQIMHRHHKESGMEKRDFYQYILQLKAKLKT